jgi:hypothetical protein
MNEPIPAVAARRRAPVWLWVLAAVALLSILIVSSLAVWLVELDSAPIRIVIDGTEHLSFDLSTLSTADRVGIAIAAVVTLTVALLVVPFALLIGLAGLVIGLVFGLGVPLLIVLLVAALVLSPLWLLVALGWWLWRRSASPAGAPAAKIPG